MHYGKPRLRSYSEEIGRYCCTGVAYARGMNSPKQASKRTGFAAMNAETIDAEGGTRGKRFPCHNPEGFLSVIAKTDREARDVDANWNLNAREKSPIPPTSLSNPSLCDVVEFFVIDSRGINAPWR